MTCCCSELARRRPESRGRAPLGRPNELLRSMRWYYDAERAIRRTALAKAMAQPPPVSSGNNETDKRLKARFGHTLSSKGWCVSLSLQVRVCCSSPARLHRAVRPGSVLDLIRFDQPVELSHCLAVVVVVVAQWKTWNMALERGAIGNKCAKSTSNPCKRIRPKREKDCCPPFGRAQRINREFHQRASPEIAR